MKLAIAALLTTSAAAFAPVSTLEVCMRDTRCVLKMKGPPVDFIVPWWEYAMRCESPLPLL